MKIVNFKPLLLSQSISWPFLCVERPIDGVRPKPLELLFLTNELRDRNDFRKRADEPSRPHPFLLEGDPACLVARSTP
jgi:hypothetical protein